MGIPGGDIPYRFFEAIYQLNSPLWLAEIERRLLTPEVSSVQSSAPIITDDLAAKVADAAKWLDEKRPGWLDGGFKPGTDFDPQFMLRRLHFPSSFVPEIHYDAFGLSLGGWNPTTLDPLWLAEIDRRRQPAAEASSVYSGTANGEAAR